MILDAGVNGNPRGAALFLRSHFQKEIPQIINGQRLVYPMHDEAMPFFNVIGNKFFSMAFSYILDTRIKDTLCGTKVMLRSDFERIKPLRNTWGINDRWGDYELIFGAAERHWKLIDLPGALHRAGIRRNQNDRPHQKRTYHAQNVSRRVDENQVSLRHLGVRQPKAA
jgi:hypothetical protein